MSNKTLRLILGIVGAVVVLGAVAAAVVHFWDDIKAKLGCNKCEFEDLEDFVEDEIDELEDLSATLEEIDEEMEDFVEFEEI